MTIGLGVILGISIGISAALAGLQMVDDIPGKVFIAAGILICIVSIFMPISTYIKAKNSTVKVAHSIQQTADTSIQEDK